MGRRKCDMKKWLFFLVVGIGFSVWAQRPTTGEQIFKDKFPEEQLNFVSNASLVVSNTIDDDLIVVLRDGGYHYISHVYVRAHDAFVFENLPVGHFVYQYFNLKTYFESPFRIPIYLNYEETLDFYYSTGAKKIIGFEITEEEFFKQK